MQLSVGVTQSGNVVNYATGIWSKIVNALKKRQLSVVACSSGVNATIHHKIVMYPKGAFPFDLIGSNLTVANKGKGYLREILDASISRRFRVFDSCRSLHH